MCFEWLDEERAILSDERAEIRERRAEEYVAVVSYRPTTDSIALYSIMERLVKLGYEPDLKYMLAHNGGAWWNHTQVKRNEPVTDASTSHHPS